jgi:putative Mg2+ transporter-C (MgtC) family protein
MVFHPEVWQISYLELSLRIVMSIALGGIIGLERELGDHAAGFRTHILVCLGSTLIVMLSMYGFSDFANEPNVRLDPARLAAQVISGIGFLGAGTIMRNGSTVMGLTTAASLWVVAAIGLCVGAGFYYGAALSTFAVLISLFLLNKLEKVFSKSRKHGEVRVDVREGKGNIGAVIATFNAASVRISDIHIINHHHENESADTVSIQMTIKARAEQVQTAFEAIMEIKDVIGLKTTLLNDQLEGNKKGKKADIKTDHEFIKKEQAK